MNFVIIFIFFMAIGPQVKWIKNKFLDYQKISFMIVGAIALNYSIIYVFTSYSLIFDFIIISSIFLILSTFFDIFKKQIINFSRIISHLSFGFLILFIGLNL